MIWSHCYSASDKCTSGAGGVGSASGGGCGENLQGKVEPILSDATVIMYVDCVDIGLAVCKPGEKSALSDTQKFQLLKNHFRPDADSKVLLAYQEVKKSGKSWKVSFQLSWSKEYPCT